MRKPKKTIEQVCFLSKSLLLILCHVVEVNPSNRQCRLLIQQQRPVCSRTDELTQSITTPVPDLQHIIKLEKLSSDESNTFYFKKDLSLFSAYI